MGELSKSQIDKLGERLRNSPPTDDDLRRLDEFRNSYSSSFNAVRVILQRRGIEPVARNIKSTLSIVAKLRRQNIKLSRIQDIAGCRIVVSDIIQQNQLVEKLMVDFPTADVRDRRIKSSHGYRAVHLIVHANDKPFEIQLRSTLQHQWAELSEKASDIIDPEIKYGGPSPYQSLLLTFSNWIAEYELELASHSAAAAPIGPITDALFQENGAKLDRLRAKIEASISGFNEGLESHRSADK